MEHNLSIGPNLTSGILRKAQHIPFVGLLATVGLGLQEFFWRRFPTATIRMSNFLPIGGLCSLIQILSLAGLKALGTSTVSALVTAVFLGTFINYVLNRMLTWQDRLIGMTRRQQWGWFMPLYLVFFSTTLMNWVKLFGVGSLELVNVSPVVSLIIFEVVGSIVNFITADKLTFGIFPWVIKRVSAQ